jgi:hypothetical protein
VLEQRRDRGDRCHIDAGCSRRLAAQGQAGSRPQRRRGLQRRCGVEVALSEPAAGQVCPEYEIGRVYACPPTGTGETPGISEETGY